MNELLTEGGAHNKAAREIFAGSDIIMTESWNATVELYEYHRELADGRGHECGECNPVLRRLSARFTGQCCKFLHHSHDAPACLMRKIESWVMGRGHAHGGHVIHHPFITLLAQALMLILSRGPSALPQKSPSLWRCMRWEHVRICSGICRDVWLAKQRKHRARHDDAVQDTTASQECQRSGCIMCTVPSRQLPGRTPSEPLRRHPAEEMAPVMQWICPAPKNCTCVRLASMQKQTHMMALSQGPSACLWQHASFAGISLR